MEIKTSTLVAEPAVVSLSKWTERVGVTPCTIWRWRKKGWLTTVNIAGRQYLTQSAIEEFHRRAVAGDFSQAPVVPKRNEMIFGS
ncbi:MAG: hypothetical protein ACLQAH_17185 [Limisphaerales bacterium]